MPYKKTKDGRLVNEVTLGDGYPLSNDLQPLKVGGEASPIEMSTSLPDGSDNGKVKVTGDLEVTGGLNFKNDVEVDLSFDDLSLSGNLDVAGDVTVDTDTLKVDTTNNRVGIGNTSPTEPLEVYSANSEAYHYPIVARNPYNSETNLDYGVGIKLRLDDASENKWAGIAYEADSAYGNSGDLKFYVDGHTNSTALMTLSHEGNLAITGDTNITGDLTVSSSSDPSVIIEDPNGSGLLRLRRTDVSKNFDISLQGNDLRFTPTDTDGTQNVLIGVNASSSTIDSRLGVGNATPSEMLDVTGNAAISGTLATGEITSGAPVWVEYPFIVTNGVAGRPYYRDVDDLYGDFRKWDDYDTSPTGISRGDVAGHYVVPENCTLKHMRAVVTNTSSSQDIIIAIYTGTPSLDSSGATTLALAGSENTVSISTVSYNYATNVDFDVDLDAGDIIVPMVEHNSGVGNQTFRGNLTLKLVTR